MKAVRSGIVFLILAGSTATSSGAERIEDLQREVAALRRELSASQPAAPQLPVQVREATEASFSGPAPVRTKSGRLTVGGLLQVWYTSFQNCNRGLFEDHSISEVYDTNEGQDHDSFRIRRAELRFTMDLTENVTSYVMIDPACEATSFPLLTDNQANSGIFKTANQVAPEFDAANGPGLGSTASILGVQTGSGAAPRLLQDAWINFHGDVPHHDFQIGQFRPWLGEEGLRDSGQLDFVERSFIGVLNNYRDLGASVHGTWWCDRLQYWLGVFDGAGNLFLTAGQFQNRSDDNDEKDFNFRVLGRPIWRDETWGSLELGVSALFGHHGEAGHRDPIDNPVNGLNRRSVFAFRKNLFLSYRSGGALKGFWLRGEWMKVQDRVAPGTVVDLQGVGVTDMGNTGSASGMAVGNPKPQVATGYYMALGYKLRDSVFADCRSLPPLEFAFRFDDFENVLTGDTTELNVNPVKHPNVVPQPGQSELYWTQVFTFGINYYVFGNWAKIQANYLLVRNPAKDSNQVRFSRIRNDSFAVNFQVEF